MAARKARVTTDTDPVVTEATPGRSESTGAAPGPPAEDTLTADHWGHDTVVRMSTPSEPTTVTIGWLADAETKMVTAAEADAPTPAAATPTTKSSGSQDSAGA